MVLTDLPHVLPLTQRNVAANCFPPQHRTRVRYCPYSAFAMPSWLPTHLQLSCENRVCRSVLLSGCECSAMSGSNLYVLEHEGPFCRSFLCHCTLHDWDSSGPPSTAWHSALKHTCLYERRCVTMHGEAARQGLGLSLI